MKLGNPWIAAALTLCAWNPGSGSAADASLSLQQGGIQFPDGSVQSSALANRAAVQVTGQALCYDSGGTPRSCAGTGEDGELQAGIAWPSPRFVDHGDGTVTDQSSGLMWLQDAYCDQVVPWSDWQAMLDWVEAFNGGSMVCANYSAGAYDDWRLPNVRELSSLLDYGRHDPELPAGSPFVNVPWNTGGTSQYFASSSVVPYTPTTNYFWVVDSRDGQVLSSYASGLTFPGNQAVWPVRGNTQGPTRVQDSGLRSDRCYVTGGTLTDCVGTGQDAEVQAGISWPTPRFTDHGDGTVTDELTGLMWLKDRECLADNQTWQQALDSVHAFNTTAVPCTEYAPQTYSDWRMANIKELHSLIDYRNAGGFAQAPFVGNENLYCSSTSFVGDPSQNWTLQPNGAGAHVSYFDKSAAFCRAWPVRGG